MKLKLLCISFALSLTVTYCSGQNAPLGSWQDYLSYQQGITVCQGGGLYYCCCASGVFSYNPSDNSLQRYNKVTGLSDINCNVARYDAYDNILVIGYADGNIDLVSNNQVINIPDLKNSSVQGSKTINNIYFSHDTAYVSCGQGILEIDLSQDIILNEFIIGPYGSALNVYSVTEFNDTMFAATVNGIYKVSLNAPDPNNYQEWAVVDSPIYPGVYNEIVSCGTKMFASKATHLMNGGAGPDSLFVYSNGKWSLFTGAGTGDNIFSLQCCTINNTPYLVYCGNSNASVINPVGYIMLRVINYSFTNQTSQSDAVMDNDTTLWIADKNWGLVKAHSNNTGINYLPPGPNSNTIFDMAVSGSNLYLVRGGYNTSDAEVPLYNPGNVCSEYTNGSWIKLTDYSDSLHDLCALSIDPHNPFHACAGSWNEGVVEYNDTGIINGYSPSNSSLLDLYPYGSGFCRIGGVGFDSNSNLWASNSSVQSNYLSVRHQSNNQWQTFDFEGVAPTVQIATKLLITHTGAKWILFPSVGILAYQDNGTFAQPSASNSVFITDAVNDGDLPSLNIYCMTEDLNGAIWIGTDAQVVVFYSPDNIYNGPGGWDAQNVYVQQTGYTQYLMQDQFTSCIAVDGANRKWIGTIGGGAFLMSSDGTQQILNFTAENSPLLSDNIEAISINQQTGEVFFATDQGLVSYRGSSTEGNSTFSNVYAYPDPVPHGYNGPIAIKNLVTNSDVKIASVSGEIVYHTVALGGQAIWNGTNFNGERVQTGVYVVFCTSPDGTQSIVTKLLLEN